MKEPDDADGDVTDDTFSVFDAGSGSKPSGSQTLNED
jgi:hypothetical protein